MAAVVPVVTYCTTGYVPYTANLFASLKDPVDKAAFVALCYDSEALARLQEAGVPAELVCLPKEAVSEAPAQPGEAHAFGTTGFKAATFTKLDVLRAYLTKHQDLAHILYVDGDIVALRSLQAMAAPFLEKTADIVFQCDEEHTAPCHDPACYNLCTGVMLLKNSELVCNLLDYRKLVSAEVRQYFDNNDQTYLNLCHRAGWLQCGTFRREECPNGVFVGRVPDAAYLIHYNYMVGAAKQAAMQENGHWLMGASADGHCQI
jgi:hypothetical protein